MSVQTLYTAATGMQSLETKLDVLANNLANINTVGFKTEPTLKICSIAMNRFRVPRTHRDKRLLSEFK